MCAKCEAHLLDFMWIGLFELVTDVFGIDVVNVVCIEKKLRILKFTIGKT